MKLTYRPLPSIWLDLSIVISLKLGKVEQFHKLQCSVASDGRGVDDEVVRRELAPFSSSVRMFLPQNGRNLARVFTGSALATHSTS